LLTFRKANRQSDAFLETFRASAKFSQAKAACDELPESPLSGMFQAGYSELATQLEAAKNAKAGGADRFCMGAAWREVRDGEPFDRLLDMVKEVKALGLETCATLGMVNDDQAARLEAAGLDYYNHNLDTSPEHYEKIISTRTFEDRLRTLDGLRQLPDTRLYLVDWGYNTGPERERARVDPQIELLDLAGFKATLAIQESG